MPEGVHTAPRAPADARCKPLRYRNDRAKSVLGWRPRYTLEQSVDRSLADGPPPLAQAMVPTTKPAKVP